MHHLLLKILKAQKAYFGHSTISLNTNGSGQAENGDF
jgi:hypothetical protein